MAEVAPLAVLRSSIVAHRFRHDGGCRSPSRPGPAKHQSPDRPGSRPRGTPWETPSAWCTSFQRDTHRRRSDVINPCSRPDRRVLGGAPCGVALTGHRSLDRGCRRIALATELGVISGQRPHAARMSAHNVSARAVRGILDDEFYVFTHPESPTAGPAAFRPRDRQLRGERPAGNSDSVAAPQRSRNVEYDQADARAPDV